MVELLGVLVVGFFLAAVGYVAVMRVVDQVRENAERLDRVEQRLAEMEAEEE